MIYGGSISVSPLSAELLGAVPYRIRLLRDRDAQMTTELLPTLPESVHEQSVRRHSGDYVVPMCFVDGYRVIAIDASSKDLTKDEGLSKRIRVDLTATHHLKRAFDAHPPALGRAIRVNDARVRIRFDQFAPIVRGGPVHAGGVSLEKTFPSADAPLAKALQRCFCRCCRLRTCDGRVRSLEG